MEINKEYIVRPTEEIDARRVWEIRNCEEVRQNSHNQEVINFATHQDWWRRKYFSEAGNQCFVLEKETLLIGYCRFDLEGKEYVISIAIDPAYHGQGWGKILLSQSLERFSHDKPVVATIATHNEVSLRLFQKYNFKVYKEEGGYYHLLFGGVNWQ